LERTEQNEHHGPQIPFNLDIIIRNKRCTKDIYNVLILQGCRTTNNEKKWEDKLNNNDLNWKSIYQLPFISTKKSKLQWLQYRINHRILATNSFLKLIKSKKFLFVLFL